MTLIVDVRSREEFHKKPVILKGFTNVMKYLAVMPYEEYGEIMR